MKRQRITITIESDEMTDIGQQNTANYFKMALMPIAQAFHWSAATMDFEPVEPTLDDYLPPLN